MRNCLIIPALFPYGSMALPVAAVLFDEQGQFHRRLQGDSDLQPACKAGKRFAGVRCDRAGGPDSSGFPNALERGRMSAMAKFAANDSRLAAFLTALLSLGMLASASFAACCGHCGTGPKAATESVHDCCPESAPSRGESFRAECMGCHEPFNRQAVNVTRAESPDKRMASHTLPLSVIAPLPGSFLPARRKVVFDIGPPRSRVQAHASIVLIL